MGVTSQMHFKLYLFKIKNIAVYVILKLLVEFYNYRRLAGNFLV